MFSPRGEKSFSKLNMPIIRKEKISKPRILLLDFDSKVVDSITEKGYVTFSGDSGLSGKPTKIKQDPSEFELIFWDCSKLKIINNIYSDPDSDSISKIKPYFDYVKNKGGIITVLLSRNAIVPKHISRTVGYKLGLNARTTVNIIPPIHSDIEDSHLKPLLDRFVLDENLKFSIVWADNFVGYKSWFEDEDNNKYISFASPNLLIFPFVKNQVDFILCALQDCFPYLTGENIFPDIHNIVWLNSDEFIYPKIKELNKDINDIQTETNSKIEKIEKEIGILNKETSFLNQALISDDSDAFTDGSKLKDQVIKMFKILDFKVKDLDEENKILGQALKEDIQIKDADDYFSIVEVKGTEHGAKASWVRTDLNAHITEFTRLKNIELSKLNSILVFNHERRISPKDRTTPFANDPNLIKYCEQSGILLIPIYELYKLSIAVMTKKITKEDARDSLKKSKGLYNFSKK